MPADKCRILAISLLVLPSSAKISICRSRSLSGSGDAHAASAKPFSMTNCPANTFHNESASDSALTQRLLTLITDLG